MKRTEGQIRDGRMRFLWAAANGKKILKEGDRVRVSSCPGTLRWISFSHFEGYWMVSKSGKSYSAGGVDRVNDEVVDFGADCPRSIDGLSGDLFEWLTENKLMGLTSPVMRFELLAQALKRLVKDRKAGPWPDLGVELADLVLFAMALAAQEKINLERAVLDRLEEMRKRGTTKRVRK